MLLLPFGLANFDLLFIIDCDEHIFPSSNIDGERVNFSSVREHAPNFIFNFVWNLHSAMIVNSVFVCACTVSCMYHIKNDDPKTKTSIDEKKKEERDEKTSEHLRITSFQSRFYANAFLFAPSKKRKIFIRKEIFKIFEIALNLLILLQLIWIRKKTRNKQMRKTFIAFTCFSIKQWLNLFRLFIQWIEANERQNIAIATVQCTQFLFVQ